MKQYKSILLLFTTLLSITALLGCGGGGGPNQETSQSSKQQFSIPATGALFAGDGILSNSNEPVAQSVTLSGGNQGTFSGSTVGVPISGSYIFEIAEGSSVGNITLTYNSNTLIDEGTLTAQVSFNSIDPVIGTYQGSSNSRTDVGSSGNTVFFTRNESTDITGRIIFID